MFYIYTYFFLLYEDIAFLEEFFFAFHQNFLKF
jgi:hypothetical protein